MSLSVGLLTGATAVAWVVVGLFRLRQPVGNNILLALLILLRDWRSDRQHAANVNRLEELAIEREQIQNAMLRELTDQRRTGQDTGYGE